MIPSTTDYSGRQVDIELLQTIVAPRGVRAVSKSIALSQPKMVAGIQKMMQRYVMLLLTRLNSLQFAPDQGTNFLDRILRGGGRSAGFIEQTFAFATSNVIAQMRREDNDETTYGVVPDDEKIALVILLDFSVDYTTSTLYLRAYVESVAGAGATYVIPVAAPRS